MAAGQIPGKVIGSAGAREINATTAWLDQLVTRYDLPQKLLLIHQFTDGMIPEAELKKRTMTPAEVMRLQPRPDVVVYE